MPRHKSYIEDLSQPISPLNSVQSLDSSSIFEVDAETMQINEAAFLADIEAYGLFTYEEFAETFPVSEVIFEAFGAQYFKVAIGKGLIDYETLGRLIERYSEFFIF